MEQIDMFPHFPSHVGESTRRSKVEPIPTYSPTVESVSEAVAGGYKYDKGKPSLWRGLLDYFPLALQQVALTSDFGAKKYKWKSWATVPDAYQRYKDALARHLVASAYEETDPESGLSHMTHVAWNALALVEMSQVR